MSDDEAPEVFSNKEISTRAQEELKQNDKYMLEQAALRKEKRREKDALYKEQKKKKNISIDPLDLGILEEYEKDLEIIQRPLEIDINTTKSIRFKMSRTRMIKGPVTVEKLNCIKPQYSCKKSKDIVAFKNSILERGRRQSAKLFATPAESMEQSDFIAFSFDSNEDEGKNRKRKYSEGKKESEPISKFMESNVPWWPNRMKNKYQNLLATQRLHHEIIEFVKFLSPSPMEIKARTLTFERVSSCIKHLWPESRVEVFGSVLTNVSLPQSDIDIVAFVNNESVVPLLKKLAKQLRKKKIFAESTLRVISKARVPIIKYEDSQFGFNVDISFNIDSGLDSAKLIQQYTKQFPALRPLTIVLKQFLTNRSLNEVFTGGLGSYALILMILSFLQNHPGLQMKLFRQDDNLGVLLIEFLELYGKLFNYENVGINTIDGGSYFKREQSSSGRKALLSIIDPQNQENDVTKSSHNFRAVKSAFLYAFNILARSIAQTNKLGDLSLISLILHIENETLEHRTFVARVISSLEKGHVVSNNSNSKKSTFYQPIKKVKKQKKK